MIHHIEFSNNPSLDTFGGYETKLPSLMGKRFDFKPGLNVVVGKNGCGKTSLLNVIRKLTFCDETFSSHIANGHGEWWLHRKNIYEGGYWKDVTLACDYKMSIWNLRKQGDAKEYDLCASMANIQQHLHSKSLSEGQQVKSALGMMMTYLMFGYNNPKAKDIKQGIKDRSFKECVLKLLDTECENSERRGGNLNKDVWYQMFSSMRDYYKNNAIDVSKEGEFKEYNGITILLDEPDKGMDVFNVEDLLTFIINNVANGNGQMICVLHNIGMIHRLKKEGLANFIELSDGYLDKVEAFFK